MLAEPRHPLVEEQAQWLGFNPKLGKPARAVRYGAARFQQRPLIAAHRGTGQRRKGSRQPIGHRDKTPLAPLSGRDPFVDFHHRKLLWPAQFISVPSVRFGMLQRDCHRFGHIIGIDQLQLRLRPEHRQHREHLDHPAKQIEEVIVRAEHYRGPQDRRRREALYDALLAQRLGFGIGGGRCRIGANGADMHKPAHSLRRRQPRDRAGCLAHQRGQIAIKRTDQIDDVIGPIKRSGNVVFAGDIAGKELQLAKIGERLESLRLVRRTARQPQARAAFQQALRDIIANIAAAAENRDKLAGSGDEVGMGQGALGGCPVAGSALRQHEPAGKGRDALISICGFSACIRNASL